MTARHSTARFTEPQEKMPATTLVMNSTRLNGCRSAFRPTWQADAVQA